MDIVYRPVTIEDATAIAQLHARSWQQNYIGIWQEKYLQELVVEDRLKVWSQRFKEPADNQYIMIAESEGRLIGFVCIFTKDDAQYGTLLDNIHVDRTFKGNGIGKELMSIGAKTAYEQSRSEQLYLWALEGNHAGRRFYEHLKGENVETVNMENPDGTFSPVCRYFWPNSKILIK